jgi:hypothetical protein
MTEAIILEGGWDGMTVLGNWHGSKVLILLALSPLITRSRSMRYHITWLRETMLLRQVGKF